MKFNSISSKTIIPILGVFAAGILALFFFIPQINEKSAVESAISNAKSLIEQYQTLRSYYTRSVVEKVQNGSNLQVTFDHKIREKAIPLPATLIMDLSDLLSDKGGIQLKLYSSFPFPTRKDRVLDDFAKQALVYFEANPDGIFVKTDLTKGSEIARIAIADKMVAESCVNCHNNHPQTPKKGWQLGNVRGVLEVIVPIHEQIASSSDVSLTIFSIIGLMCAIIVSIILSLFGRRVAKPIKALSDMSLQIAKGELDTEIDIKTHDEIGDLARNLNEMRKSIKELIGALFESKAKTEESNRTLSESEAMISAIVETSPDGIITIDERGVVESFNPAAESIFGYKGAEIKGLHISILMPCPEHETLNRYWLPVINNLDKKAKEIIGRKKDGSTFFLELSVSETSVGNEPVYTGIVRDITENKRSEQILNDYNFK